MSSTTANMLPTPTGGNPPSPTPGASPLLASLRQPSCGPLDLERVSAVHSALHHSAPFGRVESITLAAILSLLWDVSERQNTMSLDLSQLQSAVSQLTAVVQSELATHQDLLQQLEAAKAATGDSSGDQSALDAAVKTIQARISDIQAASNTSDGSTSSSTTGDVLGSASGSTTAPASGVPSTSASLGDTMGSTAGVSGTSSTTTNAPGADTPSTSGPASGTTGG